MSWLGLLITSASVVVMGAVLYYAVEAIRLARGANEPVDGPGGPLTSPLAARRIVSLTGPKTGGFPLPLPCPPRMGTRGRPLVGRPSKDLPGVVTQVTPFALVRMPAEG